jgi:protoporphyrinogen IX oxidase
MGEFSLWVKVLHILAVFAWMAALFYLPRLFVYHADVARGSESDVLFQTMERRLLNAIMTPAMLASWLFGLLTAWSAGWFEVGAVWLWAKVALVVVLSGFHGFLGRCHREFVAGTSRRSGKFFRVINEVPTVILIAIVVLVVIKPDWG